MHIYVVNILAPIVCFIVGYFFGAIPNGVLIGKIFFHKDPRNYGSGNSGGTNTGRVFGKKVGFICIALDMMFPYTCCEKDNEKTRKSGYSPQAVTSLP